MKALRSRAPRWADEEGSFLSNVIFIAVVVAVLAAVIIDGSSVYYSYVNAGKIAEEASQAAFNTYEFSKSENRAQMAAIQYCEERGLQFDFFQRHLEPSRWYEVSCSQDAKTYFFQYLPYLKDLIHQENSGQSVY